MMLNRTFITGSAIALAAGTIVIVGFLCTRQAPLADAPSASPAATAGIVRGTLRDTKTVTGTLSYGELSALRPSLATDSAMVTWMAPIGTPLRPSASLTALARRSDSAML